MKTIKVCIANPGTLSEYFSQTDNVIMFKEKGISFSDNDPIELAIEGPLTNDDIKFFRKLCGGGESLGEGHKRYVEILDLSRATFIDGNGYYFTTRNDFHIAHSKTQPQVVTSFMFAKLNIQKVILPHDIVTIERNAFFRSSIPTIIFPETIQLLEQEALYGCEIETLSINAETILQKSLSHCHRLSEITIGEKVKHINGAFGYNQKLMNIEVAPGNNYFKMQDQCLLNSGETQFLLYAQEAGRTQLIIPEGIERVCGGAIQGEASLTEIVLPESLRYIGADAFSMSNIEELHIPAEVISISDRAFPRSLSCLYFHSAVPPEIKNEKYYPLTAIYVPKGCAEPFKQKFKWHADIIQEASYDAQVRKPRKEVKNRAFYRQLARELKEMTPIEITHHTHVLEQGRFEGEEFLTIWKKNLYYIKWMLRFGAIVDISNDVFAYLLKHYPAKRPAINNLKALLTVCKVKRAQKAEEEEELRREFLNYMEEERRYKDEQDEIELAKKLFEDMMNEYEAWGNID